VSDAMSLRIDASNAPGMPPRPPRREPIARATAHDGPVAPAPTAPSAREPRALVDAIARHAAAALRAHADVDPARVSSLVA